MAGKTSVGSAKTSNRRVTELAAAQPWGEKGVETVGHTPDTTASAGRLITRLSVARPSARNVVTLTPQMLAGTGSQPTQSAFAPLQDDDYDPARAPVKTGYAEVN